MQTAKTDQADLSLRWAHIHFVGFVVSRLICKETRVVIAFNSCLHDVTIFVYPFMNLVGPKRFI